MLRHLSDKMKSNNYYIKYQNTNNNNNSQYELQKCKGELVA